MTASSVTRSLVMILLVPILFIIINELLFYFVYRDSLPFNYMLLLFLITTGLLTYITYISYAKRYLGLAFINIISSPILYFFFLLAFGGSTEVQGDDYLVGFNLITQLAFTIFSLISGTILGVLIKLITSTRTIEVEDR
ncbi:hypothetical protein [Paenibacillus endoradicis]|uniref:hypothetical protein n=1 Tax=Paenibacillus endoradicis TaxID=2972487 RepID=UPI0021591B72|nr:hypothetical protein [Paenibacillus endoradicis]MCR8656431.1 hypothetical protein [Paenibacillus endoradicis]